MYSGRGYKEEVGNMEQRSQNIFTSELFLSLLYFDLMHLLI